MSAVMQNPQSTLEQLLSNGGSVTNLAQLGLLLRDAMNNSSASGNAKLVATDASRNLTERSNVTNTAADQALALIAALQSRLGSSVEGEAGDVTNRSDQIFSNLVGTVDRGNAIASSQGFAQALRRGMADSTQASDQANNLTRNFSDVYSKLRETANQSAFDEMNKRKVANVQAYQAATQVGVPLQRLSQEQANTTQTKAAAIAQQAAKQSGQSFTDIAGSTILKGLMGMADKAVDKAGGFGALLASLSKGFGMSPTGGAQPDDSADRLSDAPTDNAYFVDDSAARLADPVDAPYQVDDSAARLADAPTFESVAPPDDVPLDLPADEELWLEW